MAKMCIRHPESTLTPHCLQGLGRIGCVSYLNALPLIDGIDTQAAGPAVTYDVPSRLIKSLETGAVDIALCPVIDYHRSKLALEIVPVGGIGCEGPTLTVRLFSQIPFQEITQIHADGDSHTSVVLLQVLLHERYGVLPKIVGYNPGQADPKNPLPQAALLIGDKVVTSPPPAEHYPHQMDLGEAWHALTNLPFVFAVWMTPTGLNLGNLPTILQAQRQRNATRTDQIADQYAHRHGWEHGLARRYLGQMLRYDINQPQLNAIEKFSTMAHRLGLISQQRPLQIRRSTSWST